METIRILAIDPGFDRMGIAILEQVGGNNTLLYSGCITTDKNADFGIRLNEIRTAFLEAIEEWNPTAVSLEKLYFTKNQKTAMRVAEARGVLLLEAGNKNLPVYEFAPNQVKLAVAGDGGATKDGVARMVRALITLPHEPKYDDEIDAIAVGITALATIKYPQA